MDIEGGKNGFKLPQERLLVVFAAIDVCKGGYKAVVDGIYHTVADERPAHKVALGLPKSAQLAHITAIAGELCLERFEAFLDSVALPALQELAQEFNSRHEMDARVRRTAGAVTITVYGDGVEEINFRVLKHYC